MQWIEQLLTEYWLRYFVAQILCELILSFVGAVTIASTLIHDGDSIEAVKSKGRLMVGLSFIVGLSVFACVGYVLLSVGITYNVMSVTASMAIVTTLFLVLGIKKKSFELLVQNIKPIHVLIVIIAYILLAIFATSGISVMSLSNDSLYYFWQYPRAIVGYGGIRDQFDNFLTDTGLGAAVIGTLPFLYGFGETFGIQGMFHISFLAVFGNAVYDYIAKEHTNIMSRKRILIVIISVLILATCTPAYILAHWAMANMYFMELFFVTLYMLGKYDEINSRWYLVVMSILVFALASIRMEGGIFVLFVIAMGSYKEVNSKELALLLVPIILMQGIYEYRIFVTFNIDNPYLFMTPGKSIIQMVAYVFMIVYVLFVSGFVKRFAGKHLGLLYVGGLIAVNLVLLIIDANRYITNIKAFLGNIFGQSGWGIMPYVLIGALAIWMFLRYSNHLNGTALANVSDAGTISYWIIVTIGFALVAIAVSFARGDALYIDTGDSGNRVLLQIAPIVVFTTILGIVNELNRSNNIE